MIRFADSAYLLLLLPLAAAAWRMFRRRAPAGVPLPEAAALDLPRRTWRRGCAAAAPLLYLAGLAAAVAALARPQTVLWRIHRTVNAIALEMAVDVSGSMAALDLSPAQGSNTVYRSRLDVVKAMFARFVEARPDDLIGLVTFGGYAATRAPLTADHAALLHVLDGVEIPGQADSREGWMLDREEALTAIGDGLATACAHLKDAEPKSKAIVLLSDGESNTGLVPPAEAARAAARLGIRVYTIGVGSAGRAPFWTTDEFGRKTLAYARVDLDEETLRAIAGQTGARYFRVDDPKGLAQALSEINGLEKTTVQREVYTQRRELFLWCLTPALGLLALGLSAALAGSERFP